MVRRPDSISFGLIGAGRIGRAYASAFSSCSVARLVAVADTDPRACREAAWRAGCVAVDDLRTMADPTFVDAVVVCTPPTTHTAISTHLLQHGVHVLCEKPLAFDAVSAQAMLDCASSTGVTLTMASKYRFVDDIIRAKSIAASGLLGDIILFENSFTAHVDMTNRWNADPATSGGGVLIDNGTHSADLMRYFLGSLAYVQAFEGRRIQRLPVEDTVRVFALSSTGVMGSIDLSWSIQKDQDEYVSIYGTTGTIHVGWHESRYRQASGASHGEWVVFGNGYDKLAALASQLDNFARALLGEERLAITPEDSLASVEVIEAAYTALRRGGWVGIGGRAAWPHSVALAATGTSA
jgi:predicted dehydrogenase